MERLERRRREGDHGKGLDATLSEREREARRG